MECYRIIKPSYASTALSGEGARLYGGRWNPPGWRCVYAANSRSLAALELLVHLTGRSRGLSFLMLTLEIDESSIFEPDHLPKGWDAQPAGASSQMLGLKWLQNATNPVMRVPSVLIPEESNFLINPEAKGFDRIRVVGEREFRLDLRFAKTEETEDDA